MICKPSLPPPEQNTILYFNPISFMFVEYKTYSFQGIANTSNLWSCIRSLYTTIRYCVSNNKFMVASKDLGFSWLMNIS